MLCNNLTKCFKTCLNNFSNIRCVLVRWMSTIIDCCFRAVFVLYPVLLKRDMCAKTFFALFRQEYSEPCQTSKMERYSENSKTLKLRYLTGFWRCFWFFNVSGNVMSTFATGPKGHFSKRYKRSPKTFELNQSKLKSSSLKHFYLHI